MSRMSFLSGVIFVSICIAMVSGEENHHHGDDCYSNLEEQVKHSYLLRHSFFRCFEMGGFANTTHAATVLALNHHRYIISFVAYLEALIAKINDTELSKAITENIEGELGEYDQETLDRLTAKGLQEEWYNGVTHRDLSIRFIRALGIPINLENGDIIFSDEMREIAQPGEAFTQKMIELYRRSDALQALAMLVSEESVSRLHEYIWNGLRRFTDLTGDQIVWFPVHAYVDEGHADVLEDTLGHYLKDNKPNCVESSRMIDQVLAMRIEMYDEIRNLIETEQGHQCPLPYEHLA